MERDNAVSPVIATILLVAVVVVLVAVLAAAVLPMVGDFGTVKSAAVTVSLSENGEYPVVTVIGGADADTLKNLTVYASKTNEAVLTEDEPKVGMPYKASAPEAGTQTISVVGTFDDGTVQTLYTGTMTFT